MRTGRITYTIADVQLNRFLYQHISWRVASLGLQFILQVLFARYFQAELSGAVFYMVAINAFLIQLTGLSLEAGLGYFASNRKIADDSLVSLSLMWAIIASLVSAALLLSGSALFRGDSRLPINYSVAFIAGNLLIAYGNAFFYARLNFVTPNAVGVIINAILIGLLITTDARSAILSGPGFIVIYFYSFLFHGIVLFIYLWASRYWMKFEYKFNKQELKNLFRFSVLACAANLLLLGLTRIDYIFIRHYRSATELGNYIQVSKIAQMFFLLPSMISAVLFPLFASGAHVASKRMIHKISLQLLLLYGTGCGILAISGRYLFPFVYGNSFDQMYVPFLLLIPGILALSALTPYIAFFGANNMVRVNIYGTLAGFLFILIADALFVARYGMRAAAAISSAGYLIYFLYVRMAFRKQQIIH